MDANRSAVATKVLAWATPLTFAVLATVAAVSPASAASAKTGEITGPVSECGPGPIVASPDPAVPRPITVRLMHDNKVILVEHIKLPPTMPWTGTFLFNVPAGRYEVISSSRSQGRWVMVSAGVKSVVTFAPVACPD